MCLESVTRVIENPTLDELVGFKVVFIRNNLPSAAYFGITLDSNELPVNKWLLALPSEIHTEDGIKYETGFHIFTERESARLWGTVHATHLIEVKYRQVIYHGIEYMGKSTHIAREMYIPWPQVPVRIE